MNSEIIRPMKKILCFILLISSLNTFSQDVHYAETDKTEIGSPQQYLYLGDKIFTCQVDMHANLSKGYYYSGAVYVLSTSGSVIKKITLDEFIGSIAPSLQLVNNKIFLVYYQSGETKGDCEVKFSELDTTRLEFLPGKRVFQLSLITNYHFMHLPNSGQQLF